MERRTFLTNGAAVGVGIGGCIAAEETSPDTEGTTSQDDPGDDRTKPEQVAIAYDPYEGISWGDVTHHKGEFHNHVRNTFQSPAQVADFYRGKQECALGRTIADEEVYTVYAVADKGDKPMKFPWTEFSDIDPEWEDRDPEEMGVVSFPGAESVIGEHVTSIFTTIVDEEIGADTRYGVIEEILEREEFHEPKGLVILGHPARYVEGPDEWERYTEELESFSREDGLVGTEIFSRKDPMGKTNRPLWDNLLSRYAPSRMFWGFGADDPGQYRIPISADVRWTTVLLDDDEFDPSDQERSRRAAMQAFLEGRTFASARRPQYDEELQEEYPTDVPTVTGIAVEDQKINIRAEKYDSIQWISNGEAVETGTSIELTPDLVPYVRAELELRQEDHHSMTCTQPWGLAAEGDGQ